LRDDCLLRESAHTRNGFAHGTRSKSGRRASTSLVPGAQARIFRPAIWSVDGARDDALHLELALRCDRNRPGDVCKRGDSIDSRRADSLLHPRSSCDVGGPHGRPASRVVLVPLHVLDGRPPDCRVELSPLHSLFLPLISLGLLRANSCALQLRVFCFPGSSLSPLGSSQKAAARFGSSSRSLLCAPRKWGKKKEKIHVLLYVKWNSFGLR